MNIGIPSALEQIAERAETGQWDQKISSVMDMLDTRLDPEQVAEARVRQMDTLVEKKFATPTLRKNVPAGSKIFRHKWVDELRRGEYRSRYTCADLKVRYSKEELAAETRISRARLPARRVVRKSLLVV